MFTFFKKKRTLVTHSGKYHADDIFACATLQIYLDGIGESYRIVRTRDKETIEGADYVFDVGQTYDHEQHRYDHHQKGGAGARDNGIEYAAFGLVWKHYGPILCDSQAASDSIDQQIVQSIDGPDNGINMTTRNFPEAQEFYLHHIFALDLATWKETTPDYDRLFLKHVAFAKNILLRLIKKSQDYIEGEQLAVAAYKSSPDKRLIVLDQKLPWQKTLSEKPEPLFCIAPSSSTDSWVVNAVRADMSSFDNRKNLPESWAGLTGSKLQEVTGVADAEFCHRGLFMAVAETKEGALSLAKLALDM